MKWENNLYPHFKCVGGAGKIPLFSLGDDLPSPKPLSNQLVDD